MMRRRRTQLLALAAFAALSCGDPTGSSDDPEQLLPREEASGSVGARDTAWYRHTAGAGHAFSVVIRAVSGSVTLLVRDSIGRTVTAPVTAAYAAPVVGRAETRLIVPRVDSRFRLLLTGDGDYRIEIVPNATPPERAAAIVELGRTLDEAIEQSGDLDDFFVFGSPGDLFIAYLQTLSSAGTGPLQLLVSDSDDNSLAEAASTGSPAEIETQPSNRWTVTDSGAYRLRLRGPYVGAYRMMVRRVDPGPETAPALMVQNDTITTEKIDYVGDIDEFTIRGPVGAGFNVMFRLMSSDPAASARAEIIGGAGVGSVAEVTSSGRDSLLADRATGSFVLGASGNVTVRVEGVGTARGLYQLLAYRINRAPETHPPVAALPDTVSESIELPGDIDEYAFELAGPDTLLLQVGSGAEDGRGGFRAWVRDGSGAVVAETSQFGGSLVGMEPVPLPRGQYTIVVAGMVGGDGIDGVRGPYRLTTHQIRAAPELGTGLFAIGDTIAEAIDPAGDRDVYRFGAERGDYLDFRFQGLDQAGDLAWALGGPGLQVFSGDSALASTLEGFGSGRVVIQQSGTHTVIVGSNNRGLKTSDRGQYRFTIRRYPSTPERHSERLAPGDVVTDELIDQLGDIDQYTLESVPGTEIAVYMTAATIGQGAIRIEVLDAVTKEILAFTASEGDFHSTGRLALPASGRLLLRVGESGRASAFARTGGYRLEIHRINRAPESRPAAIAIGDTITSESIDPVADVDEFTFTGVAGQRVTGLFDVPMGISHPGMQLEILTPSGGMLTSVATPHGSDPFGATRTPVVTLPVSGNYRVRVFVIDPAATEGAGYRFAIMQQ